MTTGALGEASAAAFLETNGYVILARNYRCRYGEIDLIAQKGDLISFAEVKTRADARFASAAEAVHIHKQERLRKTAEIYIAECAPAALDFRFDVIEVYTNVAPQHSIHMIENAF